MLFSPCIGCPKTRNPSLPSSTEGLLYQLRFTSRVYSPKRTFAWLFLTSWHFQEVTIQRKIVTDGILKGQKRENLLKRLFIFDEDEWIPNLPSFVSGPVIRIVLRDVRIDTTKRQLLVGSRANSLHNQLGVGVRRFAVIFCVVAAFGSRTMILC